MPMFYQSVQTRHALKNNYLIFSKMWPKMTLVRMISTFIACPLIRLIVLSCWISLFSNQWRRLAINTARVLCVTIHTRSSHNMTVAGYFVMCFLVYRQRGTSSVDSNQQASIPITSMPSPLNICSFPLWILSCSFKMTSRHLRLRLNKNSLRIE